MLGDITNTGKKAVNGGEKVTEATTPMVKFSEAGQKQKFAKTPTCYSCISTLATPRTVARKSNFVSSQDSGRFGFGNQMLSSPEDSSAANLGLQNYSSASAREISDQLAYMGL